MSNISAAARRLPRWRWSLALFSGVLALAAVKLFASAGSDVAYRKSFDELAVSPRTWQQRGTELEFEGRRVFYVVEGSGPAVVLLHGFPTSSWDYHAIWSDLGAGHRMIAPDLLGFGYSDKPVDYPYGIAKHADMVSALLQQLGVAEASIVAHDISVNIATELLAREMEGRLPFKIRSVVLMNGTLFAADYQPRLIQRLLWSPIGGLVNALSSEGTLVRNLRAVIGRQEGVSDAQLSAYWYLLNYPGDARVVHKLGQPMSTRRANDARWTHALCASSAPLRLVIGPEDSSSGLRTPESLSKRCEGGRSFDVIPIAGAGHFPHLEDPRATATAITSWAAGGYEANVGGGG